VKLWRFDSAGDQWLDGELPGRAAGGATVLRGLRVAGRLDTQVGR
jgi:hypothetical protein